MTYAGLTIANKPALLDAKARGAEWVARDASGIVCGYKTKPVKVERDREWYTDDGFVLDMHKGMKFVKWSDPEPVNIDLALAQIAEMEKAHTQDTKYCATGFCADPKWHELANEYGWNFCPHCGKQLKAEERP